MKFLIIIPLLRAEAYLDLCLSSILSQQGDFVLRVHIQTADQSGDVERLVSRWQQWLRTFEPESGRRHLTITAECDSGTYDAVTRGVDRVDPADDWIMSWLGADDILLPGALMTLQSVIKEHPQIRWITGSPFVASADGSNYTPGPPLHFTRDNLAAGFHGRQLGFVMQEGTFWRVSLWREAGGINRKMRFAADWDLWRRFARLERLYMLTFPLARFSHREGQLSSNMPEYYREIDSTLMLTRPEDLPGETSSFHITRHWGENGWTITEHKNSAANVVGQVRRTGILLVGMPLVTVAMVVRNAVETFADTFQSIEQQTYPNIEIIVIDGGSTDGTVELIREREARMARWISEPDKGAYDGMNKAAHLANGRWILFMNAGDFFYTPEAIEIALNGAPEQADFIIGHHVYRSEGVDELHKANDFEDTWRALITGQLSFRWLAGVPCHQATFTRTSMLTAEGGYDGRKHPIAADHEFMYRKRSKGARFYHCDEIIAVYLSGGYSWLRHTDTVRDWWQIARRYGPPEDVDRFFRESYPVAFAGDHRLGLYLRALLHTCFGWAHSPIRRRFNILARQGPFYKFGQSVARRAFPKKRPAWVAPAASIFMAVDGLLIMNGNRKKRSKPQSAPNQYPVMGGHESGDDHPAVPRGKVKIPSQVD